MPRALEVCHKSHWTVDGTWGARIHCHKCWHVSARSKPRIGAFWGRCGHSKVGILSGFSHVPWSLVSRWSGNWQRGCLGHTISIVYLDALRSVQRMAQCNQCKPNVFQYIICKSSAGGWNSTSPVRGGKRQPTSSVMSSLRRNLGWTENTSFRYLGW